MLKEVQINKVDAAINKTASGALKKVIAFGVICAILIVAIGETPTNLRFVGVLVAFLVGSATFSLGALMAAICFKSYIRLPSADLAENQPMSLADRIASIALVVLFVVTGGLVAFLMQVLTAPALGQSAFQFAVLGLILGGWWMVSTFLAHFDEHEKMLNGWRE